jgi:hypothetical protein
MRSDLVYSAGKRLNNRFLLCRMASLAARRMHSYKRHYAESINKGLTHIAGLENDPMETTETAGAAADNISVQSAGQYDTLEAR